MVTVLLTSSATRDLAGVPTAIAARMRKLVARLQQWPNVSGVKHLKGDLAGKLRLRTGDYRLQFRVVEERRTEIVRIVVHGQTMADTKEVVDYRIIVEKAGHRDGIYDG